MTAAHRFGEQQTLGDRVELLAREFAELRISLAETLARVAALEARSGGGGDRGEDGPTPQPFAP
jgi:hypothetical protein